MKVVLTAAYGMGNIGDEAIAEMAINHIRAASPGATITVLAWDTRKWNRAHANTEARVLPGFFTRSIMRPSAWFGMIRAAAAIASCDVLVWGGGGLVRNRPVWLREYVRPMRLAAMCGKKIIVLAIGVDRISDPTVKRLLRIFRTAHAISVRDGFSRDNLVAAVGDLPSVDVVSDGVFDWPAVRYSPPAAPVLGINVCNADGRGDLDPEMRRWIVALSDVLASLKKQVPFTILSLPTTDKDVLFSKYFCSLDADREHADVHTPGAYITQLARCTAFLGMRLHACILASRVEGMPVRCIAYAQKTADAFHEAGAMTIAFSMPDIENPAFRDSIRRALIDRATDGEVFTAGRGKTHPEHWLRTTLC